MELLSFAPRGNKSSMTLPQIIEIVSKIISIDDVTLDVNDCCYTYKYWISPNYSNNHKMRVMSYYIERQYGGLITIHDKVLEHVIPKKQSWYYNKGCLNALEMLPDEIINIIIEHLKTMMIYPPNGLPYFESKDSLGQPVKVYSKCQIEYVVISINRYSLYKCYNINLRNAFFTHELYDINVIEVLIKECPQDELLILAKCLEIMAYDRSGCFDQISFITFIKKHLIEYKGIINNKTIIKSLIRLGELTFLGQLDIYYEEDVMKFLCQFIVEQATSVVFNLNMVEKKLPQSKVREYFMKNLRLWCVDDYHLFHEIYTEEWDPSGSKFIECFNLLVNIHDTDDYLKRKMLETVYFCATDNYARTLRMNNIYLQLSFSDQHTLVKMYRSAIYFAGEYDNYDDIDHIQHEKILSLEIIKADEYILSRHMAVYKPNSKYLKVLLQNTKIINVKDGYGVFHPELVNESIANNCIYSDYDSIFTVYEWEKLWMTFCFANVKIQTLNWFIKISKEKGVKLTQLEYNYENVYKDFLQSKGLMKKRKKELYYSYGYYY